MTVLNPFAGKATEKGYKMMTVTGTKGTCSFVTGGTKVGCVAVAGKDSGDSSSCGGYATYSGGKIYHSNYGGVATVVTFNENTVWIQAATDTFSAIIFYY